MNNVDNKTLICLTLAVILQALNFFQLRLNNTVFQKIQAKFRHVQINECTAANPKQDNICLNYHVNKWDKQT